VEGIIWTRPAPFRKDLPCFGAAERVPDFRRVSASRSCSYVYHNSPKNPVASLIGFLKGKSAVAVARQFGGKEGNFNREHLWARGYAVSTVGFELEQVREYIRAQDEADGSRGQF